ncbi:FAD/NAD(P)-binding domain-containing protein [Lophium mytilinum]|uniref:FAD/NAD(P)-binding domain-containing protein n=1 Tax=Lophium mytilinum TaxID=390894 RepID=A0A6A6R920_9PEZI|nr:FAD/NAD(P)-binding domain-containing protein [Lophium mytilinum]
MSSTPPRRVLVIGSGGAGVAAALEASRHGAEVILLESKDQLGGATSMSGGIIYAGGTKTQKEAGVQDTKEELLAYLSAICQWTVSPKLLETTVEGCVDLIPWLEDLGVVFKPGDLYVAGMEKSPRGHKPSGDTGGRGPAGGAVLINAIVNAFDEQKVQVHTNTRITGITRSTGGGIKVTSENGGKFHGDSVVFASGGFGASVKKLAQYYPDAVKHEGWTRYIGPDSNQGDAIDLALSVGGTVVNENTGGLDATPNFIQDIDLYMPPWLLYLNLHGRRFINEMAPYSFGGPTLVAQPESRCWAVFDTRALTYATDHPLDPDPYGLGFKMRSNWEADTLHKEIASGRIIKADSLSELARLTGMPVESVEYTISKWNQDAVHGKDPEFGKKSSEMMPLDQAPYYAADVRSHVVGITYAGLKVDEEARLLDQFGRPIPHFYAAGEAVGGLEKSIYPGGGYSIGVALLFGRIAGKNAASEGKQHLNGRL